MDLITGAWPTRIFTTVGVVVGALLVHIGVWRLVLKLMRDRALAKDLRTYCRWPARAVVALAALLLAQPGARLRPAVNRPLFHLLLLALVVAGAWLVVGLVRVAEAALMRHYDVEVPDNLRARRARTQIEVLGRVMIVATVVLALAVVLLTFPQGQALGASLLASAGIAGVIAGVAARSTVGNFIAAVQLLRRAPDPELDALFRRHRRRGLPVRRLLDAGRGGPCRVRTGPGGVATVERPDGGAAGYGRHREDHGATRLGQRRQRPERLGSAL